MLFLAVLTQTPPLSYLLPESWGCIRSLLHPPWYLWKEMTRKVCSSRSGFLLFFSGEWFVCCIGWMVWRQPNDLTWVLGYHQYCQQCPGGEILSTEVVSKDFSTSLLTKKIPNIFLLILTKSLLHYSFNCSKKLELFMPEGVNINHYLRAGIGLPLCKYPPDCFSLDL